MTSQLFTTSSDEVTPTTTYENGSNVTRPRLFLLPSNPFVVPINGYVSPLLIFITVITNCLVILVLLRRHMRTPTNVMLVTIATSDMLTGIWPVPCFIFFYMLERYHDYVPYDWCFAYYCLYEFLPTIFHTASIWLTVALAVQRYIYVCHALRARELCTIPNFVRVIAVIFVMAVALHACRFAESVYRPVVVESLVEPGREIVACRVTLVPVIEYYANVYFNVYYCLRVVLIHLVPCTSLVVLNVLLVVAMRSAQRRREQLLKQNRRPESRRLAESNCTTLILVAVVGVFLLVEFPLAVLMIILILTHTFDLPLLDYSTSQTATLFVNVFILFSYPVNFFIYCGMSRQFRATFKSMFWVSTNQIDKEYTSLPATENGQPTTPAKTANETDTRV